jgi:cytochrome d ubiquinol oxidase subunit I
MVQAQPMKIAAAEALWNTEQPASMSLFTIGDMTNRRDVFAIRLPALLSILSCNQTSCAVKGINELQAAYEKQYGAGNYVPFVVLIYWAFRAMVGAGVLMAALAAWALYRAMRGINLGPAWLLRLMPFALFIPYVANTAGWIMTEMGRQPWIVFGVLKTEQAISPNVAGTTVLASAILFTVLYGALMAADVYLLAKYAKADPADVAADAVPAWA